MRLCDVRLSADDLQGSVFGFLATCTTKVVVELLFFQRVLTCDRRCRQLVDIDMKVWNDQLVADLFATSTLNYEGISGIQWP